MNEIEARFFHGYLEYGRHGVCIKGSKWIVTGETTHCLLPEDYPYEGLMLEMKSREVRAWTSRGFLWLEPQKRVSKYYIDFALMGYFANSKNIGIEIDGHEWHERTKRQVAKDKARERVLVSEGWPILRFSGSEVYSDVAGCIEDMLVCRINSAYESFFEEYRKDFCDV